MARDVAREFAAGFSRSDWCGTPAYFAAPSFTTPRRSPMRFRTPLAIVGAIAIKIPPQPRDDVVFVY